MSLKYNIGDVVLIKSGIAENFKTGDNFPGTAINIEKWLHEWAGKAVIISGTCGSNPDERYQYYTTNKGMFLHETMIAQSMTYTYQNMLRDLERKRAMSGIKDYLKKAPEFFKRLGTTDENRIENLKELSPKVRSIYDAEARKNPWPHTEDANEKLKSLGKGTIYYLVSRTWDSGEEEYDEDMTAIIGEVGGHHICPETKYYCDRTYIYHPEDEITELREATDEEAEHYITCYKAGKYVEPPFSDKKAVEHPELKLMTWYKHNGNYFLPTEKIDNTWYMCTVFEGNGTYYKSSRRCLGENSRFMTPQDDFNHYELSELFHSYAMKKYGSSVVVSLFKKTVAKTASGQLGKAYGMTGFNTQYWINSKDGTKNLLVWEEGRWAETDMDVLGDKMAEIFDHPLLDVLEDYPLKEEEQTWEWDLQAPKNQLRITLDAPQPIKKVPEKLLCRDLVVRPAMKRIVIN
jgi:hypothetical protein